jgi:hypothetical protein
MTEVENDTEVQVVVVLERPDRGSPMPWNQQTIVMGAEISPIEDYATRTLQIVINFGPSAIEIIDSTGTLRQLAPRETFVRNVNDRAPISVRLQVAPAPKVPEDNRRLLTQSRHSVESDRELSPNVTALMNTPIDR